MFEGMLGRLVGGAIWGVGAGLALTITRGARGETGAGLRPVAKSLMLAYVATVDRVREATAEAREVVEDLYAEAKTERQHEMANGHAAADGGAAGADASTAGADEVHAHQTRG